jgi:radical SAM protein (TIGR01212 family)
LEEGKHFFSRKYPDMKYLAYFQAYTNTYDSLQNLKAKYEEALSVPDVIGLVIGTRPDCMPNDLLDYLSDLNHRTFLLVEYGIESIYDATLSRINRGHTHVQTVDAVTRTAACGIRTGAHLILGLPGEDATESIRQATLISSLKLNLLKIHQLQIIRGTALASMYEEKPFHLYSPDEYIKLISDYLQHLRKEIVVERFVSQSPPDMVIAPHWGLKNYEFTNLLVNYMRKEGVWQGRLLTNS